MTLRILLVEDDAVCREELRLLLSELCYEVEGCADFTRGLRVLRASPDGFDLIVMDLHTNGMSPTDFRRAQLADPRLASIPVVVVSGDVRLPTRARELRAAAHLGKPFSIDGLVEVLDRSRQTSGAPRVPKALDDRASTVVP